MRHQQLQSKYWKVKSILVKMSSSKYSLMVYMDFMSTGVQRFSFFLFIFNLGIWKGKIIKNLPWILIAAQEGLGLK